MLDRIVVLNKLFAYRILRARQLVKVADAEVLRDGRELAVAYKTSELPLRSFHHVVVPSASQRRHCNGSPLRIQPETPYIFSPSAVNATSAATAAHYLRSTMFIENLSSPAACSAARSAEILQNVTAFQH